MKREIYEVYAKLIDANGAYNTLSGYPKVFDSHQYNDNIQMTEKRAYGAYYEALGAMCKRDDRQQQIAMIIRASDGFQIIYSHYGKVDDLPDPTYTLTVVNGRGGGSLTAGSTAQAVANTPEEGKQFSHWEGVTGAMLVEGGLTSPSIVISMPANDLTITAIFEDIPTENE